MYDTGCKRGKIKNAKILRWPLELAELNFDIVYRAGKYNAAPDTLSRMYCPSLTEQTLYDIHAALCHPRVTRMIHFVKTKNLPYSVEDVRKMIAACRVCSEVKPRFHKPPGVPLIKATQPFERLSLDIKTKYILMVIDEFSRFPFAFPCANMENKTVIQCLTQRFSLFGMCSCIPSDNAASFTSREFLDFLHKFGISVSRTSVYNPRGNGQTERYNGIVWSAVTAALKSRKPTCDAMGNSVAGSVAFRAFFAVYVD